MHELFWTKVHALADVGLNLVTQIRIPMGQFCLGKADDKYLQLMKLFA